MKGVNRRNWLSARSHPTLLVSAQQLSIYNDSSSNDRSSNPRESTQFVARKGNRIDSPIGHFNWDSADPLNCIHMDQSTGSYPPHGLH
jgi:hypothetical protein